jgi:hypothetical protein
MNFIKNTPMPQNFATTISGDMLTDQSLSDYLKNRGIKMSVATIKKNHSDINRCPPSGKIGATRYYKKEQVETWIEEKFQSEGARHA